MKQKSKQCVVCGAEGDDLRRGLCVADYQRYRRAKAKLSPSQIPAWEGELIAAGHLLPDARETNDPFAATAKRMYGTKQTVENAPAYTPDPTDPYDEDAVEGVKEAKKAAAEKAASKPKATPKKKARRKKGSG